MSVKHSIEPKHSARKLAVQVVTKFHRSKKRIDRILDQVLEKSHLSSKDKALLNELVNGTIRWLGLLDWYLKYLFYGKFKKLPAQLKAILETGLYQLKFLDKIPSYAIVNEAVELAKAAGGKTWGNIVNGILRQFLRVKDSLKLPYLHEDPVKTIAVNYSHPEWLIKRWISRYGIEETIKLCIFNNQPAAITLRVNLQKALPEEVLEHLQKTGIEAEPSRYFPDFIIIKKPHKEITQLPWFRQGVFTIQDVSTAISCLLLNPSESEIVLDLCAAPGGKSIYLAQLMKDSGVVIAVDINKSRMNKLLENLNRLQVKSVKPVIADALKFLCKPVDKILLDVPCSGLGVLAKRVDLRWRRTEQDILNIARLQFKILKKASELIKPGGSIVYSTCTIEPEENEQIIEKFLQERPAFRIERSNMESLKPFEHPQGYYYTLPHIHQMDGIFAVKLVKK
ncbi:MAG: 16S rRNA (cytosine(967)-C(5))-methyltransferase RsmB [Calditrichaeota bacterium]|nr:MAG: 16S rRNA (cytosine(967)-C(5))-methyltransferase RsmB [Calditrichota bacterium]